jgi:hypothetical protein
MTIPLDRLYHYIDTQAQAVYGDSVIIYRFWPHGSKNLQDLLPLYSKSWFPWQTCPQILCHDQEPLDYDYYDQATMLSNYSKWDTLAKQIMGPFPPMHNITNHLSVFDKSILLHSECRSQNLEKYINTPTHRWNSYRLSVYYWSHGVIARDWFRYAEHEQFEKNIRKCFLIYNRAWAGSREYRLKFTDLIIKHDIADHCLTFFNPTDGSEHYRNHKFKNTIWRPDHVLENYFDPTLATANASADFDTTDYNSTDIEVVLETLFDDDRLHLTEKSLRPIACAQPFILAATYGSLQYLKDYGFRTFDAVWDETYDTIQDPYDRMLAIIRLMQNICKWTPEERLKKRQLMQDIANYNQNHFFSTEFFNIVTDELRRNLSRAFDQIKSDPGFDLWTARWQKNLQHKEIKDFLETNKDQRYPTQDHYEHILKFIQEYTKKVANYK